MASIKRKNIKVGCLTILTVNGALTCEEIIHAMEDYFKNDVTPYLLWDFTDADLSKITEKNMRQIIALAKSNAHLRKNGKTAIVAPRDLTFGLSRMYEMLSELNKHPIQHYVFKDINGAIAWLNPGE